MSEIRIITSAELIENVPTPGMERREAASDETRIISVKTQPGLVSGWHHHGAYTTYGYVIDGHLRLESGPAGKIVVEAGPWRFLRRPGGPRPSRKQPRQRRAGHRRIPGD